jgi:hypothetical protein
MKVYSELRPLCHTNVAQEVVVTGKVCPVYVLLNMDDCVILVVCVRTCSLQLHCANTTYYNGFGGPLATC